MSLWDEAFQIEGDGKEEDPKLLEFSEHTNILHRESVAFVEEDRAKILDASSPAEKKPLVRRIVNA